MEEKRGDAKVHVICTCDKVVLPVLVTKTSRTQGLWDTQNWPTRSEGLARAQAGTCAMRESFPHLSNALWACPVL